MTILFAIFVAIAAPLPVEPATQPTITAAKDESVYPPLWRTLSHGMSVEEAAQALRNIDGIDQVTVVIKTGKLPRLKFNQRDGGIDIGAAKATLGLNFGTSGLTEVTLLMDDCASTAIEKNRVILDALKTKYTSYGREKVVDADGVELSYNLAFWNDSTRVRMSFEVRNAARYTPVYGAGNLGKLANALAENAANNALAACPNDGGVRTATTLSYTSQSAFQISQAADQQIREEKKVKTAKGL